LLGFLRLLSLMPCFNRSFLQIVATFSATVPTGIAAKLKGR
jgi:hypothetical protein